MDYKQAFIKDSLGVADDEIERERAYWKALDLMIETAADALAGRFGKRRDEVYRDILDWLELPED